MTGADTRGRGWPAWTFVLLGIALVAGLFATWSRFDATRRDARRSEPTIVVRYEGHNWIPVDPGLRLELPEAHMVMLGLDGRRTLWANRVGGLGGGGGGRPPAGLEVGAYHRIYVRLDDGRYLPMMWLSDAPNRK